MIALNISFTMIIEYFSFIILPLLIFLARVCDQSLAIMRIILVPKGLTLPPFVFVFFKSIIWLLALSQILTKINVKRVSDKYLLNQKRGLNLFNS